MARGVPDLELTPAGSIKAVWTRDILNEKGQGEFAIGPRAFEAVREGYACGACLEYRAFKGMSLPKCPTCGEPTGGYQVTAPWWA